MIKTGRVPSTERARRLCDALGLEFYIGPPRWSTIRELKEKLLTPEEQAALPPEVEQELEKIVSDRYEKIQREAAANISETFRRLEEVAQAVSRELGLDLPLDSLRTVPAELARALGLPDNCTVQEALAAIDARQRQPGAAPTGPEEYVPVDSFLYKEASIKRRALPPWADADSLFLTAASRQVLDAIEPTVPEGNLVVLDMSQTRPLHDGLFMTARPGELGQLAIERVRRSGGKWVLHSGRPDRKPRLGKGSVLYGRVAWHGPATSRDLDTSHTEENLFEINSPKGEKVREAIRAAIDRISDLKSKPATGSVQRRASGSN